MSNPTLITANTQRHAPLRGLYTTRTLAEMQARIIGESSRVRGFAFVAEVVGVSLELLPGDFISVGQTLDLSLPTREAGIIARTEANVVIDITGFTVPYVYAFAPNTDEGTAIQFLVTEAAPPPNSQYAPLIKKIAGQWVQDPAIGNDALFDETVDVRVDSGASQFFLTPTAPGTVTITGATLPNGNTYAGDVGFIGAPLFTNSSANYIWFDTTTALIANSTVGFPAGVNYLRLWILTLDGSGNVTSLDDRRPWFSPMAGAGGGGGGVAEGPGTFLQADLTTLGNQDPKPAWIYSQGDRWTWDATTGMLSWAGSGQINWQAADELAYFGNTTASGSVGPIANGDYLYANLVRAGGAIPVLISPGGPPAPALNRVLLGRRTADKLLLTNGVTLNDSSAIPGSASATFAPYGLSSDRWEAIQGNPSAPTASNYFLTVANQAAMVLDDLADVSTNEAAAFNAAGVAGATGANRLALLSDLTGLAGLRGIGAAVFPSAPPIVLTHSFGAASSYVYINVPHIGVNAGREDVYVLRRATNQIYGISAGWGASNGTVITLGVTSIGSFPFFIMAHTGTTITLQRFAGTSTVAMVIGFG